MTEQGMTVDVAAGAEPDTLVGWAVTELDAQKMRADYCYRCGLEKMATVTGGPHEAGPLCTWRRYVYPLPREVWLKAAVVDALSEAGLLTEGDLPADQRRTINKGRAPLVRALGLALVEEAKYYRG